MLNSLACFLCIFQYCNRSVRLLTISAYCALLTRWHLVTFDCCLSSFFCVVFPCKYFYWNSPFASLPLLMLLLLLLLLLFPTTTSSAATATAIAASVLSYTKPRSVRAVFRSLQRVQEYKYKNKCKTKSFL